MDNVNEKRRLTLMIKSCFKTCCSNAKSLFHKLKYNSKGCSKGLTSLYQAMEASDGYEDIRVMWDMLVHLPEYPSANKISVPSLFNSKHSKPVK